MKGKFHRQLWMRGFVLVENHQDKIYTELKDLEHTKTKHPQLHVECKFYKVGQSQQEVYPTIPFIPICVISAG